MFLKVLSINILGGTCQYVIPLYQRIYNWEYEQCMRLWVIFWTLRKKHKEGHFIGSIVRVNEDSPAGMSRAVSLDGQQRHYVDFTPHRFARLCEKTSQLRIESE